MGFDFFAQAGGKLQIIVSLIGPCNREQCLECHRGDSFVRARFTVDIAVASRSDSFLAPDQTDRFAGLIPINVRAPRKP
jgi:hypothetical protein